MGNKRGYPFTISNPLPLKTKHAEVPAEIGGNDFNEKEKT